MRGTCSPSDIQLFLCRAVHPHSRRQETGLPGITGRSGEHAISPLRNSDESRAADLWSEPSLTRIFELAHFLIRDLSLNRTLQQLYALCEGLRANAEFRRGERPFAGSMSSETRPHPIYTSSSPPRALPTISFSLRSSAVLRLWQAFQALASRTRLSYGSALLPRDSLFRSVRRR